MAHAAMNAKHPLNEAVTAVATRLRTRELMRHLDHGLWGSAFVAWLLVGIDQLLADISLFVLPWLIAAPSLLYLAWRAARSHRDPHTAALLIDRWFASNELVTTAWYLEQRAPDCPSSNVARIRTLAGRLPLTELPRRVPLSFRGAVPLGLILAAFLPLTQTGHVPYLMQDAGPEVHLFAPRSPAAGAQVSPGIVAPFGAAVSPASEDRGVERAGSPGEDGTATPRTQSPEPVRSADRRQFPAGSNASAAAARHGATAAREPVNQRVAPVTVALSTRGDPGLPLGAPQELEGRALDSQGGSAREVDPAELPATTPSPELSFPMGAYLSNFTRNLTDGKQ